MSARFQLLPCCLKPRLDDKGVELRAGNADFARLCTLRPCVFFVQEVCVKAHWRNVPDGATLGVALTIPVNVSGKSKVFTSDLDLFIVIKTDYLLFYLERAFPRLKGHRYN